MKKLLLQIIVTILLSSYAFAQAPDTLWTKTIGGSESDAGLSGHQTFDGGYIVTGWTYSIGSGIWLVKTDENGDTMWTKTFYSGGGPIGYSVQQTADSGYIIVGNVGLIKTNSNGDSLWTNILLSGLSVQQTKDSGYIITGELQENVGLIKTNENGDTLWTKSFGGSGFDIGYSVQELENSGFVIAGYTASYGAGAGDIWLIKTNESGDTIWTRTFGGGGNDGGITVQQTEDGGFIVLGFTTSFGSGDGDIWLIKTNEYGDSLWTKTFGGTSNENCGSVRQTSEGGYIIIGTTRSIGAGEEDIWLIKANEYGDTLWTKTFGGSQYDGAESIQITSDGGYILIGSTTSFGSGSGDIWLIKLDLDSLTGINNYKQIIPSDFSLNQNFPNPFNPSTKISWQVPVGSWQTLKIYDVLGNEVATLVDEYKPAGTYELEWDASDLPSGIYFYQLKAGSFVETKKMILLK